MKAVLCVVFLALAGFAHAADCGALASFEAPLPQSPFAALAAGDSCTLFVSMIDKTQGQIAAYRRDGGKLIALSSVPRSGFGAMALTHDGALLIAPERNGVMIIDAKRLAANQDNAVLARLDDGGKDAIYVAITPDDRTLFISDEHSGGISVVDLAKARANGFQDALIGTIRVGNAPVGLAIAPDGRTLYATVQVLPVPESPVTCKAEKGNKGPHREGALLAIDVETARTDPAHAVAGGSFAGCNPVRVALSPAGDKAYVTARDSDTLYAFDTAKVRASAKDSVLAKVAVGTSPVGIAVAKDGSKIYVANSDRFGAGKNEPQSISVVAADSFTVTGSIAVGAFPRELSIADNTLLVANTNSKSLSLIDLRKAP